MDASIPSSVLDCELLFVQEYGADLLIDAVTVAPAAHGDEQLPAGSPVTWWLANPSGPMGGLAADLRRLAETEVGCRIGTVSWKGAQLLVASGRDDCVVVLLQPGRGRVG